MMGSGVHLGEACLQNANVAQISVEFMGTFHSREARSAGMADRRELKAEWAIDSVRRDLTDHAERATRRHAVSVANR
jgi:hypothetical protein